MSALAILTKCPLAKCPLAKCPLAKCPLAKCPLAKCPLAKCHGFASVPSCPMPHTDALKIVNHFEKYQKRLCQIHSNTSFNLLMPFSVLRGEPD